MRPLSSLGRALPLAALLAFPAVAAEPPVAFPRGEIVPSVAVSGNPGQRYALYLPSGYTPDRPWPILYILDARRGGPRAAEVFRAGAERYGYILASSNNSESDTAMETTFQAVRAMWADTHARFPVDDRRVYAAGYSGTVRIACTLAFLAPGTIAGIIGAGAGFPFDHPPTNDTPFIFFGTVGTEDFNYGEMLDLDVLLDDLGLPHHIEVFEGIHDWPPSDLAARAIAWMDLQALRTGARAKDPALIEALWAADLERARAFEAGGDLFQAHRTWIAMAADFEGLRDTGEAAKKKAELAASPALKKDLAAREERSRRDKQFLKEAQGALASAVNPTGEPMTVAQTVAALKIPDLKKRLLSPDPAERLSAQRLLNTLWGQTASYLPTSFAERKQWDRVAFVLSIAAEIRPEEPAIWFSRAVAHARKGDRKRALADLRSAVDRGWADIGRIEEHEAFAPLRKEEEYRKIVAGLKPGGPVGS
jgi:predicted esterase